MVIGQEKVIAIAQATQDILNARHIDRKYSEGERNPQRYSVNDMVKLAPQRSSLTGKRHRPNKLETTYTGPFRITNIQGSRISLQDLLTGKTLPTQHVSNIAPFYYDKGLVNPKDVAQRASREYNIDSITNIRGTKSKNRKWYRTDLELKVRWVGYGEEGDTWEPYKRVKLSRAFKDFCVEQEVEYLLPRDTDYSSEPDE